jgi:hypothetical protein
MKKSGKSEVGAVGLNRLPVGQHARELLFGGSHMQLGMIGLGRMGAT